MTNSLLITNARILTLAGDQSPRRGAAMRQLAAINNSSVLVQAGKVVKVAESIDANPERVINAHGRVLMPAFVDCHTHACWAGNRLDEWEQKQAGASYLDILKAGGGIMSTVRSVRAASVEELTELLLERLMIMLREGTTACEIKSGYGLSTESELKMLDAIHRAAAEWPGRVSPTACIGHAKDAALDNFVDVTINETLEAVHERYPGITIDAYTEEGAWSVEETVRLFTRAKELGHPLRIHADQFNALGMLEEAISLDARSVDHLEATRREKLELLAQSQTMGVMLPCSGFHVDDRYADARSFIDVDGALAIATNANPGSAPCFSMPMSITLAVRKLGIIAAEAIIASTVNGASLLGFNDVGTIESGKRADLVLLRHRDERQLGYEFGGRHVDLTICNGEIVFDADQLS